MRRAGRAGGCWPRLEGILPLRGNELVLAHVIDTGARGELERERGRLHPPRPLPPHRLRVIGEAERQAAAAALEEADRAARTRGAGAETVAAEGEPGRVLARLTEERGRMLAVVGAGVDRRDQTPGPRSVGHTARFVLGHSPRPVLLLRGRAAESARTGAAVLLGQVFGRAQPVRRCQHAIPRRTPGQGHSVDARSGEPVQLSCLAAGDTDQSAGPCTGDSAEV